MPVVQLSVNLLPGATELLAQQQSEMPQKNDLCGAFWVTLGLRTLGGLSLAQDDVGHEAWTVLSAVPDPTSLPPGESGRTDYVRSLPRIDDPAISGTSAHGLVRAVEELAGDSLTTLALSGTWTAANVGLLISGLGAIDVPCIVTINSATKHLWGASPRPTVVLNHLLTGEADGPPPDWDVGHFIGVLGWIDGPGGMLIICADTYPGLGWRGIHVQRPADIAMSLNRPEWQSDGGILILLPRASANQATALAKKLGLTDGIWDNGTPMVDPTTLEPWQP